MMIAVPVVLISLLVIVGIALTSRKFHRFNFESDIADISHPTIKQKKSSEEKTLIGTRGKTPVYINNNSKHICVFGTTGSGKTTAIANFIKSGIDCDYPLLIVDGKGDTGERSILDITKKLSASSNKKLYVIDLNNPKSSDKYNPFKNTSPTVIKDMLINLTEWSEEHYKLNTERFLQRLITLLVKSEIPTSLKNIVAHLDCNKFNTLSSDLLKNKIITKDEHAENIKLSAKSEKIVDGAAARFALLYESDIGHIFDDNGVDIYTAIKENAIILFLLNPLMYPETSPMFGNLVVIDSKKAVSNLFSDNLKRVFFIFDEMGVYASNVFLDLVNKSRSANVTCILSTQSPSDLDAKVSEHFTEQVIENCNNYLLLRQNSGKNAERLAAIFGTQNTIDLTYQVNEDGNTGLGSAKRTREFLYHSDIIKNLKTLEAIHSSKDTNFHAKINVKRCF